MANIELQDIDEQIRKLQELRKVVADPQMASLLNQLLASKNGHSALPIMANAQGKHKAKKKGTFIEKIAETCRAFGTGEFKISDVITAFEARGFVFAAKDKSVATYSAMRRLQDRKLITVVTRGIGAKPSTYRVVQ